MYFAKYVIKVGTIMDKTSRPKKKKWPLILLGIAIIGAIGSQIECTIEVPKGGGLYLKSTPRRNSKKRHGFCE